MSPANRTRSSWRCCPCWRGWPRPRRSWGGTSAASSPTSTGAASLHRRSRSPRGGSGSGRTSSALPGIGGRASWLGPRAAEASVAGRLLLIRHGVVDFDSREFRLSPRGRQWDPPLGEAGLQQARRLAARLALMSPPRDIRVSPFTRCVQTLEPYLEAAAGTLPEPIVEDDLGEVFIG